MATANSDTDAVTPPLIAVVGITMYLAGAWGGTHSTLGFLFGGIALFIFLFILNIIKRKEVRMRRQLEWQLQDCMSNPRVAATILGPNMPPWLTFPNVERSLWFSNVIESLWPRIRKATEDTLTNSLNPLLASYCPKFLTVLKASSMSLGTVPFNVVGVHSPKDTKDTTLIDLHIQWNGNPDIRVTAAMGLVAVDVAITDLQVKGVLRMTLGPHVNVWPCFSALSLTFIGKPTLDFNLKAAKVPLDAIPGLSQWLDNFMRDTLVWLMVYPRRYVCPMLDESVYGGQDADAHPVGILTIQLINCKGLPNKGVLGGKTSPYCALSLTSNPMGIKKSTTYSDTSNPIFKQERETFTFMVYGTPDERLSLCVFHNSHENALMSNTVGLARSDKMIATAECFTEVLTESTRGGQTKEFTYDLTTGSNSREAANGTSAKGRSGKKVREGGTVSFKATYRAFVQSSSQKIKKELRQAQARAAKVKAGEQSTRSLEGDDDGPTAVGEGEEGSHSIEEDSDSDYDDFGTDETYTGGVNPLFARPTDGRPLGGLLIITLRRCNDLKKADLFGKSDPYVVFTVGSHKAKSEVVMKNLNPEYNNARFELEVSNVAQELLKISVYDYDKVSGTFGGSDEEIGTCRIALKEVFESNLRLDSTWALQSKGTISLECRLLIHEADGGSFVGSPTNSS